MSDLLRPDSTIDLAGSAAALLGVLREAPPLTHCITNAVVTGFTANVLLALGAAPAMVDIVDEAGMFAGIASGVLINLGTPTPEQRAASLEAVAGATASGTPWVLDPVAVGALPVRTALAHRLIEQRPTAIRGNASEILAVAGLSAGGRGVDATDSTDAAADAAVALAQRTGSVVAVSGPIDLITDGFRVLRLANGHELLTRVTGGGCALGAVMAAFLGAARETEHDALTAVAAASLVYTIAAERAAASATGPGSFAVALLDALAAVGPDDIRAGARVEGGTL
ncbi:MULTISPECIES: hydroxyethylthiazole kinase [unclassified Microbacterium]|uniref:hydroxyethylthiazole kinase n=1 Tax=unclassified Microbacterium TaxID=2609290 RepID=UPI000CFADAA9|nr:MULTISPECIES: hydroxyethylthiazole kinase [unclassified Microbacterium]PQZ52745.1 hydroxyethylthiazole kinase [Microbacterium sp. MYb43]PQZ74378.1 hydroxyethylthiazole kinase [Microbacterium sp. MYb40]PRB18177.1 hydroxyethylthiazole kinase [Microbacterium sp. MYb54]PRB23520.1 hydroxyethylthiazole kinase [Microbacterium sp. MYb50]PRB62142.1 hydroxyethylthiazole kinase [Microbacterium sp. MYb24]